MLLIMWSVAMTATDHVISSYDIEQNISTMCKTNFQIHLFVIAFQDSVFWFRQCQML